MPSLHVGSLFESQMDGLLLEDTILLQAVRIYGAAYSCMDLNDFLNWNSLDSSVDRAILRTVFIHF